MAYRVLVSAPYMLPVMDQFEPVFAASGIEIESAVVQERLTRDELIPYAGEIDGIICGDDPFTADVLEAFSPRLKVISKWGTGIDSIDLEAASRLGIKVCNTPGAFTEPVADSVLGYILAFARQGPRLDREMKAGGWLKVPGRALNECVLGVIGVGNIGRAVLRRARGFGMTLLGNDIVELDPNFVREVGVEMLPLEDLLARADFVSLNCDLNPSSLHLINPDSLAKMKPNGYLINMARGAVVDEEALIEVLRRGHLAGAALDVFEVEPLPLNSPLRQMDNVLLAPHNANSSPEAWERVHRVTVHNLLEGLGLELPEVE